ncbi:hypothetical protein PRJ_3981 [Pseudomonas sp. XWY-1]|nr:hypothetical protein PRJ_3981 [Pseudomonas sp. XWY-1]
MLGAGRCRSGFTRERAGPADKYPWSFTVAAATVFAGKPAPTRPVYPHRVLGAGRCRSGFTRERAGPADKYPWSFTVAAAPRIRG